MTEEELKQRTFISEVLMKKQTACTKFAGNVFRSLFKTVKNNCKDSQDMNTAMIAVDLMCKGLDCLLHDDDSPLDKSDKHKLLYGLTVYLIATELAHNEQCEWPSDMSMDPGKDYFKEED